MNYLPLRQDTVIESLHANLVLTPNQDGFHGRTLYHKPNQMSLEPLEGELIKPILFAMGFVALEPVRTYLGRKGIGPDEIDSSLESLERKFCSFGTARFEHGKRDYGGHGVELAGFRPSASAIREGNLVAYALGGRYYLQNISNSRMEPMGSMSMRYLAELIECGSVSKQHLLHHIHGDTLSTGTHTVQANMTRLRGVLNDAGFIDAIPKAQQETYLLNRKALQS